MSQEKAAIITGAGSGVGQAVALLLAHVGYHTVLVARTEAKLKHTRDTIMRETNGKVRCEIVAGDIGNPETAQRAVTRASETFGRVDAIAHVAGFAMSQPLTDNTPQQWRETIDTNVSAILYLAKEAWPIFQKQKSGLIVNVSSMASVDPFPGFSMYAPAKAAVNMLTLCLAREGKADGIRSVCIAPGAIETPMLRSLFDEKQVPRNKTLDPYEVAGVIRNCITGQRAFESGETLFMHSP